MIEKLRKKPVEVETMLWDGTEATAAAIKEWVGEPNNVGEAGFLLPHEMSGVHEHARLWVAHNKDWTWLPVGYRVARELDGSGFYPLSPEGAAAGYEMPGAEADTIVYLLWSNKHNAWWKAGGWGYTNELQNAGGFTRSEAVDAVVRSAGCGDANMVTLMVASPANWSRPTGATS
jgi:hypothetical protein